jgi:hypothetical protein
VKQLYYIPEANKASKELRAVEGKNSHIVTHVYIPKEKIRYNNKIGEFILPLFALIQLFTQNNSFRPYSP